MKVPFVEVERTALRVALRRGWPMDPVGFLVEALGELGVDVALRSSPPESRNKDYATEKETET